MAGGTWWVVVPTVDKNSSVSSKEQVDFRVQYPAGSAGDKAMRARQPYNDPEFGQWVAYWKGPYATEAQAKTAQAPAGSPENPVSGAVKASGDNPSGTTPLSGIDAIGHFFSNLSQRGFWIRIAKVGIGIVMIVVGLSKLTGAGSKIEAVAAKIPPIVPA